MVVGAMKVEVVSVASSFGPKNEWSPRWPTHQISMGTVPKKELSVRSLGRWKVRKGIPVTANNRKFIPPKSGMSCFVTNINTQPLSNHTIFAMKCMDRWCSHMATINATKIKTVIPVKMGADKSDMTMIQNTANPMQNLISITDIWSPWPVTPTGFKKRIPMPFG